MADKPLFSWTKNIIKCITKISSTKISSNVLPSFKNIKPQVTFKRVLTFLPTSLTLPNVYLLPYVKHGP